MGKLSGGEIVASILKKKGTEFLFTLCGGHISPIFVHAKKLGIRVIDVRDEAHAAFAADGISRMTGSTGVATVTAGPGITNTITALVNAKHAQSPLVLIGGAAPTLLKGRGALQDIDQMSLIKPNVKWAGSAKKVKDIAPLLLKAFEKANSGTPGPTFIEIPVDLLYPEELVREWYIKDTPTGKSLIKKVESWYIKRHVNKIMLDDSTIPESINEKKKEGVDIRGIEKLTSLISASSKPLFVFGSGSITDPANVNKLADAVKSLNVPYYLSGMARGLTGKDHPFQFRHKRKDALKNADLVVLVGVPCDFRLNYGRHIKKAHYVSINRDKEDLYLNRRPDLALLTDPQSLIIELSQKSLEIEIGDWLHQLNENESLREKEIEKSKSPSNSGIDPIELFQHLEKEASSNALYVADGGDFVGTSSYILKPPKPLSWLDPGVFGTLGVGGGFATAAKLAKPESEVFLILGDGSSAYSLMELDTFSRHDIPVTLIIGNDACWNQIARDQLEILKDDCAVTLEYSDYHTVGSAFNIEGVKVSNLDEFKNALIRAKDSNQKGKSFIINAILAKSDFRKGSISM